MAESILDTVTDWVRRSYPTEPLELKAAQEDVQIQPTDKHSIRLRRDCLNDPDTFLWQMIWERPDTHDPDLRWQTTCIVARIERTLEFAITIGIESSRYYIHPVRYTVHPPRIVATLLEQFLCKAGGALLLSRYHSLAEQDVRAFVSSRLLSQERTLPVVLLSKVHGTERLGLEGDTLARLLAGLAEVYALEDDLASWKLVQCLDHKNECFGGDILILYPLRGFGSTIVNRLIPARTFPDRLASRVFHQIADDATIRFAPGTIISGARSRAEAFEHSHLEDRRLAALRLGEYESIIKVADEEHRGHATLLMTLQDLQVKYESAEERIVALTKENEGLRLNTVQLVQFRQDEARDNSDMQGSGDFQPETVLAATKAAKEKFQRTLYFLDSAFNSAEQSDYENVKRVVQYFVAMDAIANQMNGSGGLGKPLFEAFRENGIVYKSRIATHTDKKIRRDHYTAVYNGQLVSCEEHIGDDHGDSSTCLRIYFYTDSPTQRFVIKDVGKHKPGVLKYS